MPKVSVIIPNYNHGRYLPQRIGSVLRQSFTDFECIILDDASTDNSREVIESYAAKDERISFYPSANNTGSTFIQWNKGVHLAKNELIWIAESDDSCTPGLLRSLVNCHLQNNDIGLAYCQSMGINEAGNVTGSWKEFTEGMDDDLFNENFVMEGMEFIRRFLVHKNVIPNASAVVFKKNVFMQAGAAVESLPTNSDWLTWLKILVNKKLAFVAGPHNMFRQHPESVIAKHSSAHTTFYKEQYDHTMRLLFEAWCKQNKVRLKKEILSVNHQYISYDTGNRGLYSFHNGKWLQGLMDIARASVSPHFTLGYIRKMFREARP
ncbi:MAG: glycosyltransferase family 2 protein [Ferruginibacter sp.]|nr:glycosyltransferase family 2 protein [Ferruginibacter sp.]